MIERTPGRKVVPFECGSDGAKHLESMKEGMVDKVVNGEL